MHAQVPLRCRYTAAEGDKGQGAGGCRLGERPKRNSGQIVTPEGQPVFGETQAKGAGGGAQVLGPTQCVRGEGGKLLDRSIHLVVVMVVVVVAFAEIGRAHV